MTFVCSILEKREGEYTVETGLVGAIELPYEGSPRKLIYSDLNFEIGSLLLVTDAELDTTVKKMTVKKAYLLSEIQLEKKEEIVVSTELSDFLKEIISNTFKSPVHFFKA